MDRETKRLYLRTFLVKTKIQNGWSIYDEDLDVFFDKLAMDEDHPCKDEQSLIDYWEVEITK